MARPCANTLPTAGCPDTLARWISTCSVAKPGSGTSTPTPNGTAVRPSPAPRPSVPSVDYEALATATIRGDYGNGQTRKARAECELRARHTDRQPATRRDLRQCVRSSARLGCEGRERDRAQRRHHVRHSNVNWPVAVVRMEGSVRQPQPDLSGQHRHLPW